jgi:hypothetical protein
MLQERAVRDEREARNRSGCRGSQACLNDAKDEVSVAARNSYI